MVVGHQKILPDVQLFQNMKVKMAIYNLKGKADIWWQELKLAKGLKKKQLEWSDFKKYFKKQ